MLGVSADSVFSHKAFAAGFGGIGFPLLSDWHPKGKVSATYGLMDENDGSPRRAVVIVDKEGVIRWKKVYERGLPETSEVLAELDRVNAP